ncbi:MAG: FAD-dependent oxidoreductase [Planctomycetes bacterium]|nr:FAD-dependent oxidoreductase [Planctomycetota bacterium]
MMRKKLAIIGNGMATGRLLDELIRRDALSQFEITVFGEEAHGCYNRILLNRVLLGGAVDDITLKTAAWYAENGIKLRTGAVVNRLSHAAHRLWTADGQEHYFDTAVFATGSIPRLPPIEGVKTPDGKWKDGVAVYRTAADCERMRSFAKSGRPAVVVGGGLLGLEAAKGLADLGMSVTLLHLFDTLMNRQVDKIGAVMLRRAIERLGITVRTGANTKAVLGAKRAEAVLLGGDERVSADLVVFASGVKPRIDLAQQSDVPTNAGILVDDRLQTVLPGLYAVGECAEHNRQTYGTVQPVYEQCTVLADVLTGANPNARYRGSKVYTRLKVVGIEVASMGDIDAKDADDEVVQVIEEKRGVYRKLIIRNDRLAGAVLVGDASAAAGLARRFERGDSLPANRLDLFASTDRAAEPVGGAVCNCHQVNEPTILSAVRSGCRTLQDLAARTGAGTGCGGCRGQLASLLLKAGKQPATVSN